MDRNDKLNEPLRHKIASLVINEMEENIFTMKNSTLDDQSFSWNSYSKNSSSFDTDINSERNNDSLSRFSAKEMDEQRQQNIAYEYLCHLEEAKKWIETCIREELPNATECEENLRNGVYLAKLSNFFCPEKVPFKKIFDKDQSKYQMYGLQFRHTDNINHWFKAMEHIGLPKIFFPETTDIYDRKNMPRVIYCLHALSLYLYKLGIATQIQNLYGIAKFSEEEITSMAYELAKQGLNIPEFTKIGGLLANEMPIDEAALHAAILAINDVIVKKDLEMLLKYLQLHDAHLVNIVEEYIKFYHELMYEEKLMKYQNTREKNTIEINYALDVYDELLTQDEIQNIINKINAEKLSFEINECITKQDVKLLLNLLKAKHSPFKDVSEKNLDWYMAQLTKEKETILSQKKVLDTETIQVAINMANLNAEISDKNLKLLDGLNSCLINNKRDEFILNLSNHIEYFKSEDIDADYAGSLYFVEFKYIYDEKENPLRIDDYIHGIKVLNIVVDINKVIDIAACNIESKKSECLEYDANLIMNKIQHPTAHLREMTIENLKLKYMYSFVSAKHFKNTNGNSSTINMSDSKNNISLSDSGHAESEILQCHLLTHSEIQECIIQTNAEFKHECHILQLLNESDISKDKFAQIISLAKNSLNDKLNTIDLNTYMYLFELKKQKMMKSTLEITDLKQIIQKCNTVLENALNMTKTMLLLNQIDESRKEEILNLLNNKSLGFNLKSEPKCMDMYYQTFRDLKRICQKPATICTITNRNEYFWNKTIEEYDFYLNLKNPSIYSWTMPVNFIEATHLITRSILQKAIDATNNKYELNLLYVKKEPLIIRLQALARGYLSRLAIEKRAEYLINHTKDVIKIQAWWRMIREKRLYKNRLSHLRINLRSIILLQSNIRMWICRKNYLKQKENMKHFVKKIIKIQALIRARNARVDYQSLMNDKIPSLKVISRFVHLLEHNNTDFTEEIELQELKRKVMNLIKANKNLEHDLDMMDVKIGLLIKNRITLQDVLIQHKRLRKYKEEKEDNQTSHIRQLSRENHEKMELYQNLFYLLQTKPNYLATLLFQLPSTNSSKFIETVVLQLFNYGANSREEYLLLKLFTASLQMEIENESKLDKISDIITGTPFVIKIIVSLYRKHRGENVLRNLLNPIVKEFLADQNVDLCLNPIELYKNWINKLESDTGKPGGYSYDVTTKQALSHLEIQNKLNSNIKMVKKYTAKFLHLILKSITKVPYGLRYISKVLKIKLKSKFPESTDREILKIIGNLVYYRFINSAVCSPDMYDIIDTKVGTSLNSNERKNLACISKHLNLIAMSKGYGDTENSHLACLNPFIKESHELMRTYFQDICNVPEADEFFGINEYSDLIILTKPIIYMTIQEIRDSHKLLVENIDKIAPDPEDQLRKIFDLLKHEPDLESFNVIRPLSDPSLHKSNNDCSNTINKNTQLCLTLTNRFTPNNEDKADLNNLLIRTKRLVIEILHCQSGENIEKIINTTANKEQEDYHEYVVKKRSENLGLLNPDNQKVAENLGLSLETMKKELLYCVKDLKKIKKVNEDSAIFEDIIRQIAQDIRNQRKHRQRRQKELIHLHEVHNVLNKKSELLTEQVTYYNEYVKACLDSLNSKKITTSRTRNPFKRPQSEKIQGSVKYTASKLYDKGVILEITGLQPKQFKNVMFEISTNLEPGVFDVNAKVLGKTLEKFELIFQDLLQMQYDGASIMNISGFAKINVNLLIFLLNKKFYGK